MVRTRADHLVLWPSYFDASKSRAGGRRVPKSLAVQAPTSEEIFAALKAMGISASIKLDKSYPRFWWEHGGCVTVEKKMAKTELIGKVASKLRQMKHPAQN